MSLKGFYALLDLDGGGEYPTQFDVEAAALVRFVLLVAFKVVVSFSVSKATSVFDKDVHTQV